jgi:hypothetical protein
MNRFVIDKLHPDGYDFIRSCTGPISWFDL